MAIYLLFIQHIIASLKPGGKAAVVVPTGFITAASGIELRIRQKLVDEKMIAGVVSMPSNIFATTGTNVSILFLDAARARQVVLIDASALGTKVKEGKNQKTLLSHAEEQRIVDTFNAREAVEDFSVVVDSTIWWQEKLVAECGAVFRREDCVRRHHPGAIRRKTEGL